MGICRCRSATNIRSGRPEVSKQCYRKVRTSSPLLKNTWAQSSLPADAQALDWPSVPTSTAQVDKAAGFPHALGDSDRTTVAASSAPVAVAALVLSIADRWQAIAADTLVEVV